MSKKVFRNTVSGFTHLGGAVLAIAGTVFLALGEAGNVERLASFLIFGISMALLFSASATYHLVTGPAGLIRVCHIIDHCMIYVLIAGTYTPIVSVSFTGALKWGYIIGIWAFAFAGILLKAFFTGRFRILSTIIYLVMGWSVIFAIVPLARNLPTGGVVLLLSGGAFYTAGGVIYAAKRPNIFKYFGFHELFHIFVLLGALAHYFMVLLFL
ncbi:MAG: hemolysin-III related [Firmicutes bacterium ADurb.Bin193]|nr:MAG: hemolysin-III related [Firmicutes bacterium ADurb.Bin193]